MSDKLICDKCGKIIEGHYASLGGNMSPYYSPAKIYHVGCVPSFKAPPSLEYRVSALESQVQTLLSANGDFLRCIGGLVERLGELDGKGPTGKP